MRARNRLTIERHPKISRKKGGLEKKIHGHLTVHNHSDKFFVVHIALRILLILHQLLDLFVT